MWRNGGGMVNYSMKNRKWRNRREGGKNGGG
jgi:hypothetical protein